MTTWKKFFWNVCKFIRNKEQKYNMYIMWRHKRLCPGRTLHPPEMAASTDSFGSIRWYNRELHPSVANVPTQLWQIRRWWAEGFLRDGHTLREVCVWWGDIVSKLGSQEDESAVLLLPRGVWRVGETCLWRGLTVGSVHLWKYVRDIWKDLLLAWPLAAAWTTVRLRKTVYFPEGENYDFKRPKRHPWSVGP